MRMILEAMYGLHVQPVHQLRCATVARREPGNLH